MLVEITGWELGVIIDYVYVGTRRGASLHNNDMSLHNNGASLHKQLQMTAPEKTA